MGVKFGPTRSAQAADPVAGGPYVDPEATALAAPLLKQPDRSPCLSGKFAATVRRYRRGWNGSDIRQCATTSS